MHARFCVFNVFIVSFLFMGMAVAGLKFSPSTASAADVMISYKPDKSIVTRAVLDDIKAFVDTDIVRRSIIDQNKKYGIKTAQEIEAIDQMWRGELKSDDKPLVSATLSNPLSAYLTRVQAHSTGLYTEIFVMDQNGLNVGQSNITSDYWQGDEAKFQKTYGVGANAVFIDDPEFDDNLGIWRGQVNMTLQDEEGTAIGAITVEINMSELLRRRSL